VRGFRFVAGAVLLILAGYNVLTIPLSASQVPIWDVSRLTHQGTRIWLVKAEPVDQSTTRYGVSTTRGNPQRAEFYLLDREIDGQLNAFYSWSAYQVNGESLREEVLLQGAIWTTMVLVLGFLLSRSDRQTYLVATKICGIASALGVFGLVAEQLPYLSAIVSFIPSAGWGIVMPTIGIVLDRALGRYVIDVSIMDVLEGMIDEIVFSMAGYTALVLMNTVLPVSELLPW
jgi:hypothetical protein